MVFLSSCFICKAFLFIQFIKSRTWLEFCLVSEDEIGVCARVLLFVEPIWILFGGLRARNRSFLEGIGLASLLRKGYLFCSFLACHRRAVSVTKMASLLMLSARRIKIFLRSYPTKKIKKIEQKQSWSYKLGNSSPYVFGTEGAAILFASSDTDHGR